MYYINEDGALVVSGGIYLDTRLPCYNSWKYDIANGFLQESLLKDADREDDAVSADDFCVLGDSVNNKVSG